MTDSDDPAVELLLSEICELRIEATIMRAALRQLAMVTKDLAMRAGEESAWIDVIQGPPPEFRSADIARYPWLEGGERPLARDVMAVLDPVNLCQAKV